MSEEVAGSPRYLAVDPGTVPAALRTAAAEALEIARREVGVSPVLVWLRAAGSPLERVAARMEELIWTLARAGGEYEAERRGFTDAGPLAGATMPLHPGPDRVFVVAEGSPADVFHATLHEAAHVGGYREQGAEAVARRHCPGCAHCRASVSDP